MFDAMAAAASWSRTCRGRELERIEGHADGPIPDSVDQDLPAALVEHGNEPVQLAGRKVRCAGAPAVGVWSQQCRSAALDDAVGVDLHGPGFQRGIVAESFPECLEAIDVSDGRIARDREGQIGPDPQVARVPCLLVERGVVGVDAGIVNAGDAEPMSVRDRRPQGGEPVRLAGSWHDAGHERRRRFLQVASRLASRRDLSR